MQGLSRFTLALAGAATILALGCQPGDGAEGSDSGDAAAAETLNDAAAEISSVNRSGITGIVEADRDGDEVEVTVRLQGLQSGSAYPASLHEGRCAAGGAVAAPLGRITAREDGTGSLTSRVTLTGIAAADPVFVQVESAGGDAVACGDLGGDDAGSPITDRLETDTLSGGAEGGA